MLLVNRLPMPNPNHSLIYSGRVRLIVKVPLFGSGFNFTSVASHFGGTLRKKVSFSVS